MIIHSQQIYSSHRSFSSTTSTSSLQYVKYASATTSCSSKKTTKTASKNTREENGLAHSHYSVCPLPFRKCFPERHGRWCGPLIHYLILPTRIMNLLDSLLMLEMDGRQCCPVSISTMPWFVRRMLLLWSLDVLSLLAIGKCCMGRLYTFYPSFSIGDMRGTRTVRAYFCLWAWRMLFGLYSLQWPSMPRILFWEMVTWISLEFKSGSTMLEICECKYSMYSN